MKTFKQILEELDQLLEASENFEQIKSRLDSGDLKVLGKTGQKYHSPLYKPHAQEWLKDARKNHPNPEVKAALNAHHSNPEHEDHDSKWGNHFTHTRGGKAKEAPAEVKPKTYEVEKSTPAEKPAKAAPVSREDNESKAKERVAATAEKMKAKPAAEKPAAEKPAKATLAAKRAIGMKGGKVVYAKG